MQYRTVSPRERGVDSEEEALLGMQASVRELMTYASDPARLLDSLLVIVNICEQRAMVYALHPEFAEWYTTTAALLRQILEHLTGEFEPCPDETLEDPQLYFPPVTEIS